MVHILDKRVNWPSLLQFFHPRGRSFEFFKVIPKGFPLFLFNVFQRDGVDGMVLTRNLERNDALNSSQELMDLEVIQRTTFEQKP